MSDAGPLIHPTQPPPRQITPAVRRRAFAELPVRPWVILSALILSITIGFTISRLHEAVQDRWLISHGTPVEALFAKVNGVAVSKRTPRNEPLPATLSFTLNGQQHVLEVELPVKPDAFAQVGTTMPIRVDPANPNRWTEQTVPLAWVHELTIVLMLIPVCLVLLLVTYLRYRSMLSIYRGGIESAATVVDVRHTAAAPNQRLVRVHYNSGDRRVFSLLAPVTANLQKGQSISLLHLPQRSRPAILVSCYS